MLTIRTDSAVNIRHVNASTPGNHWRICRPPRSDTPIAAVAAARCRATVARIQRAQYHLSARITTTT